MLLDRYRSERREKTSKKVYELITREYERFAGFEGYHSGLLEVLRSEDRELYNLIKAEYERQRNTLHLVAAENRCSRSVLAALASILQNKTAEGFVGQRLHGGCEVVDQIESLAIKRAKQAFAAQYANVQPHSGSTANQIVFKALLEPQDTVLILDVAQGGHPSHGGRGSLAESFYKVQTYDVSKNSYLFEYDEIREEARRIRPKLILCGASAYPREIDFAAFREIADEVGAHLLADISHIAGLILAGVHPSPIDYAHVTTTSTYKAGGPRGGLILLGKDCDQKVQKGSDTMPLWESLNRATFPGVQGTPHFNNIAAKAVFLKEVSSAEYQDRQLRIVENARRLASNLLNTGFDVLTGGTDNHMILLNVNNFKSGLSGIIAQTVLQSCNIVVDSYRLAHQAQQMPPAGLRLGTAIVTRRGMGLGQMDEAGQIIEQILSRTKVVKQDAYEFSDSLAEQARQQVGWLCNKFSCF